MVAYTKPQQRQKEESKKLRGERDQMKFKSVLHARHAWSLSCPVLWMVSPVVPIPPQT